MKIKSDSARKSKNGNGSRNAPDAMAEDDGAQSSDTAMQEENIAVAAYFRAEQRGFAPGNELGDWFQAESDCNTDSNPKTL